MEDGALNSCRNTGAREVQAQSGETAPDSVSGGLCFALALPTGALIWDALRDSQETL